MTLPPAPAFAGYCRKCYYSLAGAASGRCPECGREFDPANAKTFLTRPPSRWRWVRRGVLVLAMVAVLGAVAPRGYVTIVLSGATSATAGRCITRYGLVKPRWMSWVRYPYWTTRRDLNAAELAAMRSPPPGTVTLAGMSAAPCDSSIVLVVKRWGEVPTSSQGSASGGYGLVACMTDPREPPASITQMLGRVTDAASSDGLDTMATMAMQSLPE